MMAISVRQMRWLGLCGLLGGILWAGNAVAMPAKPGGWALGYGHIALSMLFIVGLLGFYAQQRDRAGKVAKTGFIFLFTSFLAWSAVNVLGTGFSVSDKTLLMNLLGAGFFFLLAPGFLFLGIGLKGPARRVPLAIASAFAVWFLLPHAVWTFLFPSATNWNRGDSPAGITVFFLMGIGLALMGYSVFRNAAPAPSSRA